MSRRRTIALSTLALIGVIGLSTLVGFVGEKHGFGWDLAAVFGTALGTTLLAIATGVLALLTWRDVNAAQELAQLTRDEASRTNESLELSRAQSDTARAALDAQTQPFLTVGDISARVLHSTSAHVRNVGNAPAVVMRAAFIFRSGAQAPASAVDPAMPAGETTSIILASPRPPDEPDDDFSVAVAFGDVGGRPRGAVRLDVRKRERPPIPGKRTSTTRRPTGGGCVRSSGPTRSKR